MNKIRTYSCLFWAHVFTAFAAVQYNDPDPYVWIPIYMFAAALCIISIFRPINKYILVLVVMTYIAGSIALFPVHYEGVSMPMNQRVPAIEEARESLGLLICAVATLWLLFLSYRMKSIPSLK